MTFTRRRTQRTTRRPHDTSAPVAYLGEACRKADAFGIAQTVYHVIDREDVRWFEVSNSFWDDSETVRYGGLDVLPLVTMLPFNYFER